MTNPAAIINSLSSIRSFLTAGNALFTLVSKATGARKTFLVEQAPHNDEHRKAGFFVKLLVGPDNGSDYRYLGFMYEGTANDHLRFKRNGNNFGNEACGAFEWMITQLNWRDDGDVEAHFGLVAEFWHSGRCARCGRTLTDPHSIETGLGPVCAEKGA